MSNEACLENLEFPIVDAIGYSFLVSVSIKRFENGVYG
jgi:hypothetical protein